MKNTVRIFISTELSPFTPSISREILDIRFDGVGDMWEVSSNSRILDMSVSAIGSSLNRDGYAFYRRFIPIFKSGQLRRLSRFKNKK